MIDEYDEFRDLWCDRLETAMDSLLNAFLKEGYYKDNPIRLKDHILGIAERVCSLPTKEVN